MVPRAPVLLTVKVPPCTSSIVRFPSRAFVVNSFNFFARPEMLNVSASLITGTTRPSGAAIAILILTLFFRMIESFPQEEFIKGFSFRDSETAFITKGK